MAVGEGGRRHMQETIGALTSNLIEFRRGSGWGDGRASAVHTLLPVDAAALQGQDYVESVTPLTQGSFTVRYRDTDAPVLVSGVGDGFFKVRNVTVVRGRAFTPDDLNRQSQVAVIDLETRRRLFMPADDPIGKVIIVGNVPCTVIGVTSAASQQLFSNPGLNVLLPYTTAGVRLFGRTYFDSIIVRSGAGQDSTLVENSLSRLLAYQHGAKDFFTNNMDTLSKAYASTTRSITLMLSLIASIALLVGGVGVMNIMLVSVSERTREIGIRMAAGARRADISRQFLSEAVAICVIGGVAGVALALLSGYVFSVFVTEWHMVFTAGSFILAFGCALLIGLIFGFVPARQAAELDPSAALARE
jgi:macrolide transport system ATP-binding/permease protein